MNKFKVSNQELKEQMYDSNHFINFYYQKLIKEFPRKKQSYYSLIIYKLWLQGRKNEDAEINMNEYENISYNDSDIIVAKDEYILYEDFTVRILRLLKEYNDNIIENLYEEHRYRDILYSDLKIEKNNL